jgi:exodeoxyribonuclease VII small subunit
MPENKRTFEDSMNRLDEIVKKLESGNASMDETIQLFDEGMKLVKECDSQLHRFETSINEIIARNGGNGGEQA